MYSFKKTNWKDLERLSPKSFVCWNCGDKIASVYGYITFGKIGAIYICSSCDAPIIIDDNTNQVLLPLPGKEIKKLPKDIDVLYSEIRRSMQSKCFTGAVMLMRKIIMNIAVHEGAKKNLKFVQYVNFLYKNGIVPKKSKSKADSVKDLGNDANHEIENRTLEEAQKCFEFIELLLKVNYEFADEENSDESLLEDQEEDEEE